jgi:hypothetical protein
MLPIHFSLNRITVFETSTPEARPLCLYIHHQSLPIDYTSRGNLKYVWQGNWLLGRGHGCSAGVCQTGDNPQSLHTINGHTSLGER